MGTTIQPSQAVGPRSAPSASSSPQAVIAFLAEAALGCLDIYALYDLAVDLTAEALGAEFVTVLHQPKPGEPLIVMAGCGWGDDVELGQTTVAIDRDSDAGYTLLRAEPVLFEDLVNEDRFKVSKILAEYRITSGMSVVIPGDVQAYGVLQAHTRERRRFTADEADFLRSTANILGGARENIITRLQIEREAVAREQRLHYHAALARCAQSLLASGGESRLERGVEALLDATRATYVFVERNVMDPGLGFCSRTVVEVEQPGAGAPSAFWDVIPWERMPTTRHAMERGESIVIIPSELESPEFDVYAEDPLGVASEIDVPIFVDGEWAGLIGLAERQIVRDWTDEDRSLLTAVATMIGAYWERDGARNELLEAIRSKDMFLASVSHELRTPLTTVVGSSEILRDDSLELSTEERSELLDMVVTEGTDLVNIVSDLLAAAKADSGTLIVSRVAVNLRAQAAQVLEGTHQNPDAPIALPEESVSGFGDPDRVRQIVRNLVTNAQRYGGDTIRVEFAHDDDDMAVVRVCDNGSGIPEGDRERVFEAYQSAHGVPGQTGSIGLGLAISRRLARLMAGDLTYEYVGGESVFTFSLPRVG